MSWLVNIHRGCGVRKLASHLHGFGFNPIACQFEQVSFYYSPESTEAMSLNLGRWNLLPCMYMSVWVLSVGRTWEPSQDAESQTLHVEPYGGRTWGLYSRDLPRNKEEER